MISDQNGLHKSYNTEDGLYEDTNTNTLFIAGIRNMNDVLKWPKIQSLEPRTLLCMAEQRSIWMNIQT